MAAVVGCLWDVFVLIRVLMNQLIRMTGIIRTPEDEYDPANSQHGTWVCCLMLGQLYLALAEFSGGPPRKLYLEI